MGVGVGSRGMGGVGVVGRAMGRCIGGGYG